jgi:hypothetical protein
MERIQNDRSDRMETTSLILLASFLICAASIAASFNLIRNVQPYVYLPVGFLSGFVFIVSGMIFKKILSAEETKPNSQVLEVEVVSIAAGKSAGATHAPSWGRSDMDSLDASLRAMLAASGVPAEDQSSILHRLASDIDTEAFDGAQAT